MYLDVLILFSFFHVQVEGVLVTMMTHPEVVQLIRGVF